MSAVPPVHQQLDNLEYRPISNVKYDQKEKALWMDLELTKFKILTSKSVKNRI